MTTLFPHALRSAGTYTTPIVVVSGIDLKMLVSMGATDLLVEGTKRIDIIVEVSVDGGASFHRQQALHWTQPAEDPPGPIQKPLKPEHAGAQVRAQITINEPTVFGVEAVQT